MYPKEFFVEKFKDLENEELLIKLSEDLAENARSALIEILSARGVASAEIDGMVKQARKAEIRKAKGTSECDFCGNSAKSKPVLDGGQRFCRPRCLHAARISEAAVDLSEADITTAARAIQDGDCPTCRQSGSLVEVRFYHRVMSFGLFTRYTKSSKICCMKCGRKENLKSFALTFLLGWWGMPFGVLFTPTYLLANVGEMFERRRRGELSEELVREARYSLASQALQPAGPAGSRRNRL